MNLSGLMFLKNGSTAASTNPTLTSVRASTPPSGTKQGHQGWLGQPEPEAPGIQRSPHCVSIARLQAEAPEEPRPPGGFQALPKPYPTTIPATPRPGGSSAENGGSLGTGRRRRHRGRSKTSQDEAAATALRIVPAGRPQDPANAYIIASRVCPCAHHDLLRKMAAARLENGSDKVSSTTQSSSSAPGSKRGSRTLTRSASLTAFASAGLTRVEDQPVFRRYSSSALQGSGTDLMRRRRRTRETTTVKASKNNPEVSSVSKEDSSAVGGPRPRRPPEPDEDAIVPAAEVELESFVSSSSSSLPHSLPSWSSISGTGTGTGTGSGSGNGSEGSLTRSDCWLSGQGNDGGGGGHSTWTKNGCEALYGGQGSSEGTGSNWVLSRSAAPHWAARPPAGGQLGPGSGPEEPGEEPAHHGRERHQELPKCIENIIIQHHNMLIFKASHQEKLESKAEAKQLKCLSKCIFLPEDPQDPAAFTINVGVTRSPHKSWCNTQPINKIVATAVILMTAGLIAAVLYLITSGDNFKPMMMK